MLWSIVAVFIVACAICYNEAFVAIVAPATLPLVPTASTARLVAITLILPVTKPGIGHATGFVWHAYQVLSFASRAWNPVDWLIFTLHFRRITIRAPESKCSQGIAIRTEAERTARDISLGMISVMVLVSFGDSLVERC